MVVLPEPEGPIKVTRSPCATVKFRSFSTVLSPKRLTTSVNSMCGVSGAAPREVTLSPGWNLPPPAEAELWLFSGKFLLQFPDEDGRGVAGGQADQTCHRQRFRVPEGVAAVADRLTHHLADGRNSTRLNPIRAL